MANKNEEINFLVSRILNYIFKKKHTRLFIELEFINPKCSFFSSSEITCFDCEYYKNKEVFKSLNEAFSKVASSRTENIEKKFRAFLALIFLNDNAKFNGFTKLISSGGENAEVAYLLAKMTYESISPFQASLNAEKIIALYMAKEP